MKKLLTILLIIGVIVPVIAGATLFQYYTERGLELPSVSERLGEAIICGIDDYIGTEEQNEVLEACKNSGLVGGSGGLPITDYETTLTAPLTSTATTINVASVTTIDDTTLTTAIISPAIYLMVDPDNDNKKEIIKCTTVSSLTYTGCTRGLSFSGTTETAVAANKKSHSAGVRVVNTNVHYYYISTSEDQTWSGEQTWTAPSNFTNYPTGPGTAPTSSAQLVDFNYVNALAFQGVATGTEANIGAVWLGTRLEMASSTSQSSTGAPLVLQSQYASDNTRGFVFSVNQTATTSDQIASSTSNFYAQTFLTSATTTRINAIDISLKKTGTPTGLFRVGIYLTDTDGVPTTNLQSVSLDISTLGTEYEVKRFDIGNAAKVSPDTTYAIVLDPLTATITDSNYIDWAFNDSTSGDLYTDGSYYASTTATSWTASSTADFYFQIYGNEPATSNTTIISDSGGKLDWSYIDLTRNVKPTGIWTFTGDTTFTGDVSMANATTTGSMDVAELCFDGANCVDEIIPSGIQQRLLPDGFRLSTSTNGNVGAVNRVVVFPVYIADQIKINRFSIMLEGGTGSGKEIGMGLYDMTGTKVIATTGIDTAGGAVYTSETVATTTVQGSYLLAWTSDTANLSFEGYSTVGVITDLVNGISVKSGTAANASSNGLLPATLGTITEDPQNNIAAILISGGE